jgi:hypothetical protein
MSEPTPWHRLFGLSLVDFFSGLPVIVELVRYGTAHYRIRSDQTSKLLGQLFKRYRLEGPILPDLLEQLAEQTRGEIIQTASADELLRRLKPETIDELIKKLPAEERLQGLPAEERIQGLSVDNLLAALSPETRAALARKLRDENQPSNPESAKPEPESREP